MFLSVNLSAGSPELLQAQLKVLRDQNFNRLLVCTFMVGIGLLMELPEIIHDMCEIYGRRSRELKYWLSLPIDRREYPASDWVKKWAAFGWLLIVLGVMGEGWFEARVSKYDSALSQITDRVVAEARKESLQAEATAKGFDAQIALAQKDAADSKKEAESERLERVKLQEKLAARRLSGKQISDLAKSLKLLNQGHVPIAIMSEAFDNEAADLAKDFEEAFTEGEWKPTRVPWDQLHKQGVEISMLADPSAPNEIPAPFKPLVEHLRVAIATIGVTCGISALGPDDAVSLNKPEKNVLYLMVHRRPEIETGK